MLFWDTDFHEFYRLVFQCCRIERRLDKVEVIGCNATYWNSHNIAGSQNTRGAQSAAETRAIYPFLSNMDNRL